MDDKGYAFTPMALLLIIPVMIIAISYGNIVNELNMISQIAIGGDVTYGATNNVITTLQKSLGDAGRNATFNATRTVIDNEVAINTHGNPFLSDSRLYIKNITANELNVAIISTCQNLSTQTARQIYINNTLISNTTPSNASIITANNLTIYQTDPFGFYISINKGIPLTVTQNGQNFTGYTQNITSYVSIQGTEDPYIWVNTLNRRSDVIYKYPFYDPYFKEYHFADNHYYNTTTNTVYLQHLWDCLNGTDNNASVANNPYYFPDTNGMTFFDRLENKTSATSIGPPEARMSTFILGDPLMLDINGKQVSCLDHEYFANTVGAQTISVDGYTFYDTYPTPAKFYLSQGYLNSLGLTASY
jgi:hypothetical protein